MDGAPTDTRAGGASGFLGQRFGRYVCTGELGSGSMGMVFKARDEELGRDVAVKVLKADIAMLAPGILDRFHLEARALAKVRHPNIVMVYESGQTDWAAYLALEYVEGGALSSRDCSRMPATRKMEIVREVARALQHAHEHGLVHRDVKPSNILVRGDGTAVLTDFGLVHDDSSNVRLTQSLCWIGTPAYMSPEQAEGYTPRIDHRTDIYSLGVVLYELVSGRVPFVDLSLDALRDRISKEDVPPLRKVAPGVSRGIEAVTMKALERRPEERYQTAGAFAEDLDRLLKGEEPSVRPAGWGRRVWLRARRRPAVGVALGAALVLAGVVGALAFAPSGAGAAAKGVAEGAQGVLAAQTRALRAAAKRLDVSRVGAALEVLARDPGVNLRQTQDDIESERVSAQEGEALLRAGTVVVVDARDRVILPSEPSPSLVRAVSTFRDARHPTELLTEDADGAWIFGSEAIGIPGAPQIGGWALVGEPLSETCFHDVVSPRGAGLAWIGPDGRVAGGCGLGPDEARRVEEALRRGDSHARVRGRDCLIGRFEQRYGSCLVAVPDARWRAWLAYTFAALAGLGCLVIAFASLAALDAARYAATYRAAQGVTVRAKA